MKRKINKEIKQSSEGVDQETRKTHRSNEVSIKDNGEKKKMSTSILRRRESLHIH
jgi:hypothetical protein